MCDACNEQFYLDTFGEEEPATMGPNLQPDTCESVCVTCGSRIPDDEEILPDPEYVRSWSMVFCSEACKAMQASLRI